MRNNDIFEEESIALTQQMYKTSIFNDVLGPVMTGPSSSHTAGPGRIGYLVGSLLENVTDIRIRFPVESSYSATYKGQGSDRALVGGILGYEITAPEFRDSLQIAKERGVRVEFSIEDLPAPHPNTAYIEISNGKDRVFATTFSVGGGAIEIVEICGTAVSIRGNAHLIAVLSENKALDEIAGEAVLRSTGTEFVKLQAEGGKASFFKVFTRPGQELLDQLQQKLSPGSRVRYMPPVLPVEDSWDMNAPFTSAEELLEFLKKNPMEFWEAAVQYECQRSGWPAEKVIAFAEYLLDTMENSIWEGLRTEHKKGLFWKPAAKELYGAVKEGRAFDLGVLNYAHVYATSIMEYNSAAGKVCAGPTAGSCGVLGGMLFSICDTMGCSREKMVQALLCAGLIGVFISEHATFGAEVAACQAENGSASCMAAGAATYLLGGTIDQILTGAALAMQNLLGLVCDPIAGCAAIPCINRNSAAIANAVVCANLAVGGYDAVIPFDQCVEAMYSVGKLLPRELRCTGLGGLCVTETGQRINREFNDNKEGNL